MDVRINKTFLLIYKRLTISIESSLIVRSMVGIDEYELDRWAVNIGVQTERVGVE